MACHFNFKKFALIRMKLRASLHTAGPAGNERVDKMVRALSNGRAAGAMKAYEQFIGISDVKAAQNRVTEIEDEFLEARLKVSEAGKKMDDLQSELHVLRSKLDRTPRDDPKFLDLATEEHRMLQAETQLKTLFSTVETKERDTFSKLSAAVRESHERQRAQEERTKYWSVIGSVLGTLIGVVGSSVVNHRRMHELRTLVEDLGKRDLVSDSKEIAGIIQQLKDSLGGRGDSDPKFENLENMLKRQEELQAEQLKAIETLMSDRNSRLAEQIKGVRQMSDVGMAGDTGTLEELLSDTEQKLEWEMKMSTLSTVVFIYGAFALTLPILYSIFK